MAFQKPSHTFTKIHLKGLRTNSLKILFTLSFTVFINTFGYAQDIPPKPKPIQPKEQQTAKPKDTTTVSIDSVLQKPPVVKDSILNDSIKKPKEFLANIVNYNAEAYVKLDNKSKKIYLYDKAVVTYQDMKIEAGTIVIDNNTGLIYAGRIKDSTGYSQAPVFTQAQNVVEPDSIIFNKDTKKAIIFNSKTEDSGFNIFAPITKRENDSTIFMKDARFTTAEDLDDPEYQFISDKIKFVPGKKIVVGPTYMEIYGVPTAIALPFAYFPLSEKQTSGVIFPTFGEDIGNDRGYFLQNGGYYFAINDYLDLAVLGDYYTNGSYGLRLESNYAKRYGFGGNVNFRYENLINSERGFSDFSRSTIYNIQWSHSQDSKANPNSRFSASVNLGSSQFFSQSNNQLNITSRLNNTLASSVSYSRTFNGEPQVNVNVSATHSQNTQTEQINLTLPTLQVSVGRVFPFAPKNGTKKGIIQNINFQYSSRAEYRINTVDSLFGRSEMFDDALAGMQHSIPITTNFKVLDHFSVSASTNFQENWTLNTINRSFDQTTQEVVTTDLNGFDSFRTYNFSASIGTTLYGLFPLNKKNKDAKIQAIRHVIRPSLSYTINPAFNQFYETYEVIDADGTTTDEVEYTRFEQSLFGAPGNRYSSSIGLSIGNNIEAKVRSKDSTDLEPKKIVLINNLNISTSYDLAADSLNLSPVRLSGGLQLLKDKMSINFGATLDPYALDNNNTKINTFNINNGGSLFRLTSANMNMSYSLSNETFSSNNNGGESERDQQARDRSIRSGDRTDDLFGVSEDYSDHIYKDEDEAEQKEKEKNLELYNSKIPWSLRLAYAVNYTNTRRENRISSHSLMFSGDVDLSPKWAVGVSSGYDFQGKGFSFTQFRFERDLLSWRMNFSWVPFGTNTSWNFFIGIKSNFLKDLKYEKRRQPDQTLGN